MTYLLERFGGPRDERRSFYPPHQPVEVAHLLPKAERLTLELGRKPKIQLFFHVPQADIVRIIKGHDRIAVIYQEHWRGALDPVDRKLFRRVHAIGCEALFRPHDRSGIRLEGERGNGGDADCICHVHSCVQTMGEGVSSLAYALAGTPHSG